MSSSAINTQVAQLKIGNVQNQADSSAVYSNGVWSFKNSTALTSVTITDSRRVGINTTTPVTDLVVNGTDGNSAIQIGASSTASNNYHISTGTYAAGSLIFWNGNYGSGTERMRIHASGAVSMLSGLVIGSSTNPGSTIQIAGTVLASGAGTHFLKWNNVSGTVTYDTSSRLVKDKIENLSYGLNSVLSLQPRKYFRTDDQKEEIGFIADEVHSVIPEVVPMVNKSLFTKNEQDIELIPGGVNYDKLTAVLVKAIQEQQAQIEALKAEVAALKAP